MSSLSKKQEADNRDRLHRLESGILDALYEEAGNQPLTCIFHGGSDWFVDMLAARRLLGFGVIAYKYIDYDVYIKKPPVGLFHCFVVYISKGKKLDTQILNSFNDTKRFIIVNDGAYPAGKLSYLHPKIDTVVLDFGSNKSENLGRLQFLMEEYYTRPPKIHALSYMHAYFLHKEGMSTELFKGLHTYSFSAVRGLYNCFRRFKAGNARGETATITWLIVMLHPKVFVDPMTHDIATEMYKDLSPIQRLQLAVQLDDPLSLVKSCGEIGKLVLNQDNIEEYAEFTYWTKFLKAPKAGLALAKKIAHIIEIYYLQDNNQNLINTKLAEVTL